MIRRRCALLGLGVLAACAADRPLPPADFAIALAVDSISLRAGDSVMPAVVVTVNGVRRIPNAREVIVSSSDTGVLAVAANDALMAVGHGTATVTVAWAATPSISVSRSVTVTSETLTGISLTTPLTMVPRDTATFAVSGTIRGGRRISDPASAVVTSRNPGVVVASGFNLIAVAAGSTWIVANAASGVADSSAVTVAVGAPVELVISPRTASLGVGQVLPAAVAMTDRRGNPVTTVPPTFTSSSPAVASVQSGGMVTGVAAGSALIIARAGTAADTLRITVSAPAIVLARLVVFPDSVTLSPGGSTPILLQAFDTQGGPMPVPAVTWRSQTNGITVTSAGIIQAAATIATTIPDGVVQVSSGSISAQVRVAVVVPPAPPPPSDNGYVQIRWVGDAPSADVAAAFEAARVRINGLFASFNGVGALALSLPAEYCMSGSPALNETVKGIVLFAQVGPIDGAGQILGSAGPCILRSSTLLPIVGSMQFDAADMSAMVASGILNGVVLHEMMHTLGFGTVWGPGLQGEVAAPDGADPRFIGANGQTAYAGVGGTDAPTGVPVENTGGVGTRGSHWRESVFRSELMTGWADGTMPLSRVTIGALKDLGYDVDLSKADPYTLPSLLTANALLASQLIVERTTAPIGVVGLDGRITPVTGTTAH